MAHTEVGQQEHQYRNDDETAADAKQACKKSGRQPSDKKLDKHPHAVRLGSGNGARTCKVRALRAEYSCDSASPIDFGPMNKPWRIARNLLVVLLSVLALVVLIVVGLSVHTRIYQTQDRRAVAPAGSTFVRAADTDVLVQRAGDGRAPAVLFVHGTGSWSELWRAPMEQLAAAGFHAVAIDLPPFGYSIPPASRDYSKHAQAKRIIGVLDALGIDQAIFVGHSFGAGPLMEAVFAAPARVRGVVLVDAALGLQSPAVDGDTVVQRLAHQRWLSETLSAAFLTNPIFTKTLLRAFVSEKERANHTWVAIYRQPLFVEGAYRGVAAWLPELLGGRGNALSDDPQRYAALNVPVTLIWGETDSITPLEQALDLQQRIPNSVLLRLPRAGHIPQIEEPQAFSAALGKAIVRR